MTLYLIDLSSTDVRKLEQIFGEKPFETRQNKMMEHDIYYTGMKNPIITYARDTISFHEQSLKELPENAKSAVRARILLVKPLEKLLAENDVTAFREVPAWQR